MTAESKSPNFAPWDRAQFLERLKTYRHVDKWMGKPEKISEVQWAKQGWSCTGKETVGCVGGCGKSVVVILEDSREEKEMDDERPDDEQDDEDEWREKAQEELVEKYAVMISSAHEGGCLWRRRACDDTIQRLPLVHQATAMEALKDRYQSLVPIADELPPDPSVPEGFDIKDIEDKVAPFSQEPPKHPPNVLLGQSTDEQNPSTKPTATASLVQPPASPIASAPINTSALILALFGWQAEAGHISGLVTCTACFRRLGLWLFKPTSTSDGSSMDRLDVVDEHRDYCPWVNELAQNGATLRRTSLDGSAGWEMLVRAIDASAAHRKEHDEYTAATNVDDGASEVDSEASLTMTKEARAERDEKDKERWAKLKRLKQVFHVKRKVNAAVD